MAFKDKDEWMAVNILVMVHARRNLRMVNQWLLRVYLMSNQRVLNTANTIIAFVRHRKQCPKIDYFASVHIEQNWIDR